MTCQSTTLKYILFADDTTGIYSSTTLDNPFTVVDNEMSTLTKWYSSNKLQINASKTKLALFMTHQKEARINIDKEKYLISLDGTDIAPSNEVKFLGLLIKTYHSIIIFLLFALS